MASRKLSLKKRIILAVAAIALVYLGLYLIPCYLVVRSRFDAVAHGDAMKLLESEVGAKAVEAGTFFILREPINPPLEGLVHMAQVDERGWGHLTGYLSIRMDGGYTVLIAEPVSGVRELLPLPSVYVMKLSRGDAERLWNTLVYLWRTSCSSRGQFTELCPSVPSCVAAFTWPNPALTSRFPWGRPRLSGTASATGVELGLRSRLTDRFARELWKRADKSNLSTFDEAARLLLTDFDKLDLKDERDHYLAEQIISDIRARTAAPFLMPRYKRLARLQYWTDELSLKGRWYLRVLPSSVRPGWRNISDVIDVRYELEVLDRLAKRGERSRSQVLDDFTFLDPYDKSRNAAMELARRKVAFDLFFAADPSTAKSTFLRTVKSPPQADAAPWFAQLRHNVVWGYPHYFGDDPGPARVFAADSDPAVSLYGKCVLFVLPERGSSDVLRVSLPDYGKGVLVVLREEGSWDVVWVWPPEAAVRTEQPTLTSEELLKSFKDADPVYQIRAINLLWRMHFGFGREGIVPFLRELYPLLDDIGPKRWTLRYLVQTGNQEDLDFSLAALADPRDFSAFFARSEDESTSEGGQVLSFIEAWPRDRRVTDIVLRAIGEHSSKTRGDSYYIKGLPADVLAFLDERALPVLDGLRKKEEAAGHEGASRLLQQAISLIRVRHAKDPVAAIAALETRDYADLAGRVLADCCSMDTLEAMLADPAMSAQWPAVLEALRVIHEREAELLWRGIGPGPI